MQHTILVTEDNPESLELARVILDHHGYRVLTATNGQEALTVVREERPDLILMDLSLPVMDGWTVIRKLKADPELGSIPIIAMTAFAMDGDEEEVRKAGADGYISKPIDIQYMVETIAQFL